MKIHVAFSGLGAGNIGDEAMMQGFLSIYPLPDGTTIEVWDKDEPVLKQFPDCLRFVNYTDTEMCTKLYKEADMVLIVGATIVNEMDGLEWPLKTLGQKYETCHRMAVPCHAVGVGADQIRSHGGRQLFNSGFLPIESWTVRSVRSRDNLTTLGVSPERVCVTADLAWLTPLEGIDKDWAQWYWKQQGRRQDAPLIGVNMVNERWRDNAYIKTQFAQALDELTDIDGFQIAFLCNETREGNFFDKEAALSVVSLMRSRPIIVPNKYFTPQEMAALLSFCDLTVSWRYHFTLLSFLTGSVPLSVIRGEKLLELVEDISTINIGTPESITKQTLIDEVRRAFGNNERSKTQQATIIDVMRQRSKGNAYFIKNAGDMLTEKT
ncbi:MAG: polysaccharide pyruvyl transferase family protein [Nitrospirae bacterium]|nr:polysaccharide pyruvyl transferase family protein [Nitrospirota bacterium]